MKKLKVIHVVSVMLIVLSILLAKSNQKNSTQKIEATINMVAMSEYQLGCIAENELKLEKAFERYKRATELRPENEIYKNQFEEFRKKFNM